ncbi:MAG: LemA family protein [Actinobacteria bacterium]|nr:LemA family protein [Actinomycetota bacterium]
MEALASGARSRPRWLVPVAIVGGLILLLVLPLIGSYNGLVDREARVDEQFANLDAQLQRRNDLIPNLVAAVQGALQQEQEVFGEIARARQNYAGAATPEQKEAAAGQVTGALGRLLVIVEQYPELRSNENIRDLQVQLEGTENRIAQARRDYNTVVVDYNRTIRRFPRSIFAGLFGFERRTEFTADVDARDAPTVDLTTPPTTTG